MTRRRRPRTAEERLIAAVGTVARGVAGGRVRNVRQVSPHARGRNTGPAPSAGFDPNADPVVIGSGANGGGATGGVVIGVGAHAAAADATAIGDTAVASGTGDTVVGANANSPLSGSQHCTAIGEWATIDGARDSATAIGYSAAARADNATALGAVSNARHAHATAVGAGAATTAANQVMLGTAADFVEIPGVGAANGLVLTDTATGTRYIIQIASGALALNTAP